MNRLKISPGMLMRQAATRYLVLFALVMHGSSASADAHKYDASMLVASSAQAGIGAQNAAQSAAQSSKASSAAASCAPVAPQAPAAVSSPSSFLQMNLSTPALNSMPSSAGTQAPAPGAPELREYIRQSSTPESQDNSIESFFQVSKPQLNKAASNAIPQSTTREKKSFWGSTGRAAWHILDNAGVPMFYGNHDMDLDPSLTRNYENPPLPAMDKAAVKMRDKGNNYVQAAKASIMSPISESGLHKIPEGELEGTELLPTRDGQKPTTP